jgi:hypothetical protein
MQQPFFARGIQRLALGIVGALVALASAQATNTDTAVIELKANGADQRIKVDMRDLAEGQSRQLSADSGLPAIVTRTAEGLRVEIAGVVREIELPKVDIVHAGGEGEHRRVLIKRTHAEEGEGQARHEVRVIERAGEGALDEAEIEALVEEARQHVGHAGELGEDKVRVIRRIEKHEAQ